jgi:hypothetical protein
MTRGKALISVNFAVLMFLLGVVLVSCTQTSSDKQNEAQERQLKQGVEAVGVPNIINWTEMRLLKRIYELRDDAKLRTWVYSRDLSGKRHCEGVAIGYGMPYATMFTNPDRYVNSDLTMQQAEPNGLFPFPAEASWWQMLSPTDGKAVIVYAEDRWNAYPYQLPGIPCPGEPGWAAYEGIGGTQ